MKKKTKNIKAKKSVTLNKSNKTINKTEVAKAKQEKADKLKKEKNERKEQNIANNQLTLDKLSKAAIDKLSKALLSMGGVKKTELTPQDKELVKKKTEELRELRKQQYEQRRLRSLKRRLKLGEKSEEEMKKSLEELKKEMAEQKRYDVLLLFNQKEKEPISAALAENKITATYISNDYLWIKNTDIHIVNKLRGLPLKFNLWPYKAVEPKEPKEKATKKPTVNKTVKKPTANTIQVRKAAKARRKTTNLAKFMARHAHAVAKIAERKALNQTIKQAA